MFIIIVHNCFATNDKKNSKSLECNISSICRESPTRLTGAIPRQILSVSLGVLDFGYSLSEYVFVFILVNMKPDSDSVKSVT